MMKCVIVDDEKSSREMLSKIIEKYCPELELCAQAEGIESAYKAIVQHQPKMVFLDIEMPEGTAFDLLERFEKVNFFIIFTTAYEQYALHAIKVEAVDYLLKPISVSDVLTAVERMRKFAHQAPDHHQIVQLMDSLQLTQNSMIPIPTSAGLEMVNMNDILYCEADESYTYIFLNTNSKKTISKRIGDLEKQLPETLFFRTHHSYLVNRASIKNYIRGEGGSVLLQGNIEVPVSRRKKVEFLEWLKHK
jgi:two-component system LytT family response regulator